MTEANLDPTLESPDDSPWPRMSKEDINAYPMRKYEGRIRLIQSQDALIHAVGQLEKETILGFDTETRPTFRSHESYLPSLLQLAGTHAVYLFQLKQKHLSKHLRRLLANPNIIKAGTGLDRDIVELKQLAPFEPGGFVDIGDMAKKAGLNNHGLRGLAAVLLGFRISKRAQTSNWAQETLTRHQIEYAATDAWVGRELYLKLHAILEEPLE